MKKLNAVLLALTLAGAACIGCSDDGGPKDAAVKDGGGPDQLQPDSAQPDMGPQPNSGALCTGGSSSNPQGSCKSPKDLCVPIGTGSYGMCLMECTPGTQCPVPKGQYASICAITFRVSSTKTTSVCGWFCKYGAAPYYCPNNDDYDCWVYNSAEPDKQFCRPNK